MSAPLFQYISERPVSFSLGFMTIEADYVSIRIPHSRTAIILVGTVFILVMFLLSCCIKCCKKITSRR